MFGYWGRILKVNLSTGEVRKQPYDKRFARTYLGGNGFAARLLADNVAAGVDPLDDASAIVFAVGPLTGTPVWGSSRCHVAAISPLTGLFADSNFGGDFAVGLKRSGFDAIFITGRADRPVCLQIDERRATIEDAAELWGRTTEEANHAMQEGVGGDAVAASIGPAGEVQVPFACIVGSGRRPGIAGRCGMGAVMGSKMLKGIVATGRKQTQMARVEKVKAFLAEGLASLRTSTAPLTEFGTPMLVDVINDRGLMGTHNASREQFEHAGDIGHEAMKRDFIVGNSACRGCPVACGKRVKAARGAYAGRTLKMPEYESIFALGSMLDNRDLASLVNANGACDLYGLDTISMGVTLSFVAECIEKGIVSEEDIGGRVRFDDGQALTGLVQATAERKGIGRHLALGSERLAERFGPEAQKLLYTVKGLEIAGHSARGLRPMSVGYATATRGGSHHDTRPKYLTPDSDPGFEGQALHSVQTQNFTAVGDSLVLCRFTHENGLGRVVNDATAELLSHVTGWDIDARELERIGERIYNLERLINVRRGVSRKDDVLPYRTMNEPIPGGPAEGRICRREDLDAMLDEYYRLRGWTRDGIPTEEKLTELGLQ
jgi:aldehyde:ferredoxin oxidoreductase